MRADVGEKRYAREPLRNYGIEAARCRRPRARGARAVTRAEGWRARWFLRRQFLKADVGDNCYAREPLRKRVQGKAAKAAESRRSQAAQRRRPRARGARAEGWRARWFLRRQFLKADVGDKRYACEQLRSRVRRAKQRKQRNLVGPKQRGAGGRVREGREPRVGEPVGFCDANF